MCIAVCFTVAHFFPFCFCLLVCLFEDELPTLSLVRITY